MFDKLDFILEKYEELSKKVSDPDVIAKQKEWQKLMKEMSDLEPIVKEYTAYKKAKEELGWVAKRDIEKMCQDAWRWQKNNPNGFED